VRGAKKDALRRQGERDAIWASRGLLGCWGGNFLGYLDRVVGKRGIFWEYHDRLGSFWVKKGGTMMWGWGTVMG
jgi:hypothetical protein